MKSKALDKILDDAHKHRNEVQDLMFVLRLSWGSMTPAQQKKVAARYFKWRRGGQSVLKATTAKKVPGVKRTKKR